MNWWRKFVKLIVKEFPILTYISDGWITLKLRHLRLKFIRHFWIVIPWAQYIFHLSVEPGKCFVSFNSNRVHRKGNGTVTMSRTRIGATNDQYNNSPPTHKNDQNWMKIPHGRWNKLKKVCCWYPSFSHPLPSVYLNVCLSDWLDIRWSRYISVSTSLRADKLKSVPGNTIRNDDVDTTDTAGWCWI